VEIDGQPYLFDRRATGYSLAVLSGAEADFLSTEPFPMLAEYGNPFGSYSEIFVTEGMLALCRSKAATHVIKDFSTHSEERPVEIQAEPFFASSISLWWEEVDRDPLLAPGSRPEIIRFEVVLRHATYSNFLLAAGEGPRAYLLSPIGDEAELLVSEAPLSWLDSAVEWDGEPFINSEGFLQFADVRPAHHSPHPGAQVMATHVGRWAENETALIDLRPLADTAFPLPVG
jgi:hypothetical protein